jgi:MinD-like ATPase involved in chromosome partitioning or flagellar assembly
VAVVDTNFQSPTLSTLFGLANPTATLNDYLWGDCPIETATYTLPVPSHTPSLYLVPAKPDVLGNINKILRKGYADNLLAIAFEKLIETLNLDVLLIDLYAGLQEETLFTINISDMLVIVLRPDAQDYQGSSVTVEVTRHFQPPPQIMLVLNELPHGFNNTEVQEEVERIYHCDIVFTLPHADEITNLNNNAIFVQHYPLHPITTTLTNMTSHLG